MRYVKFTIQSNYTGGYNLAGLAKVRFQVAASVTPTVAVTSPADGEAFATTDSISVSSAVTNGTPPYSVSFYTNSGGGAFALAGVANSAPYALTLDPLATGTYQVHATVTDSTNRTATSSNQTFSVAETVEIDNGLVKARFIPSGLGVKQQYFASSGTGWMLLAESFRPSGLTGSVTPLYDASIDTTHRFLTSELLNQIVEVQRTGGMSQVVLQGTRGGSTIRQTVQLHSGQAYAHIETTATLAGSTPTLEYLLVPLVATLDGTLDATHAPTLKPSADSVIGDRAFHAPLVSVQQGGRFVGLVPDLGIINSNVVYAPGARQHPDSNALPVTVDPATVSMPTALDLELQSGVTTRPVLAYGMMDYIVHQHVWFQHLNTAGAMVRTLSTNQVKIGMDLLLSASAPTCRGYQVAAQHLWQRYGSEYFGRPRPQAMPYAEYAKVCYPANIQYQSSWQQWETAGQPVGGLRLYAPQWSNFIANLGWWNNVCDATGLYYWGKQLNDADLLDKARRMVNLALSAPQNQGLFPGIYDSSSGSWLPSLWTLPLTGYNPNASSAYWGWNSGSSYQTAAASVTAGYLLQYRRTCEENVRIVPYVTAYGDFLLASMQTNGCVPAWFNANLTPLPSLTWNADGGAHVWTLSELYLATGQQKYLDGAKKAANFLLTQVMPQQRWADFEAFYSCAIKPETYIDTHTGQWPCNTMSMSWALQGFLSLHEATQDNQYLDAAAATADFAALFQSAWAPEYVITAYPFGGMLSQKGDAEWLDQRAHRFAEPFVRIGLLTGRQDLVERGIAAGRSSLTLVNHVRHQANGIYAYTDYPLGLGPENIDHEGFPQRPLTSGPSWTSMGGLAGMAQVLNRLGGAYVDFDQNVAVGVDGLKIVSFQRNGDTVNLVVESQLAALPVPYDQSYLVAVRMSGLPAGAYNLVINNLAPVSSSKIANSTIKLKVSADGTVALAVPEIIASPASLVLPPSGTGTSVLSLSDPASDSGVTVTVTRTSGDANIVLQGASGFVFGANDWNVPQTMTFVAPRGANWKARTTTFLLQAPGYTDLTLTVTDEVASTPTLELLNGSFENTTGGKLVGTYDIFTAANWTNLTVGSATWDAGSTSPGGTNGNFDAIATANLTGTRYLRLASDQVNSGYGAVVQNLGTMAAGETYTVKADAFGGNGNVNWSGKVELRSTGANSGGTVYASATAGGLAAGAFAADAFTVAYTATAADSGNPLWLRFAADLPTGTSKMMRGGIDNVRLTVTATGAYASWASTQGLTGAAGSSLDPAFDADPNQDGIQNGMAWILGAAVLGAPAANRLKLPAVTRDGTGAMVMTFERLASSAASAPLVVQYGDGLGSSGWTSLTVSTSAGTTDDGNISIAVAPGAGSTTDYDRITVTIPATYPTAHPKTFARLMATE
ncbi:MAG: Ig-like domain-containing protein [Verrucomicrobia bacterium]|nr:Ig-like domain-containing protein [Verrucomicrobiota bacterium]